MSDSDERRQSGQQPMTLVPVLLTLLTCALWGGTPTAIRFTVETLPPVLVAGIRFLMACGFMLVWLLVTGKPLVIPKRGLLWSAALGTLLFFQISLFNVGIEQSNASHGTLLINTFVFWVVGIEHISGRERLSRLGMLGVVIAASGVVMITGVDKVSLLGDAILLGSGFVLGIKIILTKRATTEVEPAPLIFWHDIVGTTLFFAWSLTFESFTLSDFTPAAIWGLLYQGVLVAGLCFVLQAELLKRHPAHQIAVYSFSTPLFGMIAAVAILGEPASRWLLLSALAIALGIVLVNRKSGAEDGGTEGMRDGESASV